MKNEPAAILGLIGTAVAAVMTLLVAFFVPLTPEQQTAILGVVAGVGPLVVAMWIRPRVTPNGRVIELEQYGKVVAGKGSELATGTVIRDAGSLDAEA